MPSSLFRRIAPGLNPPMVKPFVDGAGIWHSRLWKKYVWALVGLSLGIVAAFGLADGVATYRIAVAQAAQLQLARARETEHALRVSQQLIDRSIQAVQTLPLQSRWLGAAVRREEYGRLLRLVAPIDELAYENERGQVMMRVSRRDTDSAAAPATPAGSALPAASPPAGSAGGEPFAVSYSADLLPVVWLSYKDPDGPQAGRTRVGVSLLSWSRELRSALTAPGMEVYVVDHQGRYALHREPSVLLSRRQLLASEWADLVARRTPADGVHAVDQKKDGRTLLRTVLPIESLGWTVVVEQPGSDLTEPVVAALWRTAAFVTAAVLLATLAAALLAGRMTRPIRQLHLASARMSDGELDTRVDVHTNDELEDLAHQFNRMAASLQASVAELEDKVTARTIELQRANQHKDEFLANMSHELRTPLSAILGFADVLHDGMAGPMNDEQREYVTDIRASGLHLLSLINDLLDLSRIEAGLLRLEMTDFDVAETVESAVVLVGQACAQKGLQLQVSQESGLALWFADARRVKQMLVNLLVNAVKFTPAGGRISVHASTAAHPSTGQLCLKLDVQDTGKGIAAADHERVFEVSVQVDDDAAGRAKGSGLGLALVRRFARAHGGDVTLTSALGAGATFHLVLPAGSLAAPGAQTDDNPGSTPP